jgi:hypothetical protein
VGQKHVVGLQLAFVLPLLRPIVDFHLFFRRIFGIAFGVQTFSLAVERDFSLNSLSLLNSRFASLKHPFERIIGPEYGFGLLLNLVSVANREH